MLSYFGEHAMTADSPAAAGMICAFRRGSPVYGLLVELAVEPEVHLGIVRSFELHGSMQTDRRESSTSVSHVCCGSGIAQWH